MFLCSKNIGFNVLNWGFGGPFLASIWRALLGAFGDLDLPGEGFGCALGLGPWRHLVLVLGVVGWSWEGRYWGHLGRNLGNLAQCGYLGESITAQ